MRFEILRANVILTANDIATVFNFESHAPTGISIIAVEYISISTLIVQYAILGTTTFIDLPPVDAGLYVVRITFPGSLNFNPHVIYRAIIIERAEATIINTTVASVVFNGNPHEITASLNHIEADLAFSQNHLVNAGTYIILISSPQTLNFRAASIVIEFTIYQRVMTNAMIVFPTASSITFGQFIYQSNLIGGSTVFGVFAWQEPNRQPAVAQTQHLVGFTPYDTHNNDWSQVSMARNVNLVVNRLIIQNTQIAFPTGVAKVHGQSLSAIILNQNNNLGLFAWENLNIQLSTSGNAWVSFTPHDITNLNWGSVTGWNGTVVRRQINVTVSHMVTLNLNGGTAVTTSIQALWICWTGLCELIIERLIVLRQLQFFKIPIAQTEAHILLESY